MPFPNKKDKILKGDSYRSITHLNEQLGGASFSEQ